MCVSSLAKANETSTESNFPLCIKQRVQRRSRYRKGHNGAANTCSFLMTGRSHRPSYSPRCSVSQPSPSLSPILSPPLSAAAVRCFYLLTILLVELPAAQINSSCSLNSNNVPHVWSLPPHQAVHCWDRWAHPTSGWPVCSCVSTSSCSTNTSAQQLTSETVTLS